jgi:hypothetical protein
MAPRTLIKPNVRFGQKQTNHPRQKSTFVRFGPKADKRGRGLIVR